MIYKDLLHLWIEEKKLYCKNDTIQNYSYAIKNWITPHLGNLEISDITQQNIQEVLNLAMEQRKAGTANMIRKVVKQSLEYAYDCAYISELPYRKIKLAKDKAAKEIKVFSIQEIDCILNSDCAQVKKDIVTIAFRTGMRIGEILVLEWDDIDFSNNFLTVRKTLSGYKNGVPEISEPKTTRSKRRIDLDTASLEVFERIRSTANNKYVFAKKDGSIYSRQMLRFRKICENAGVEPRNFHTLRHTHASILLANGVHPKIVQERLGHSSISVTLDIYSHLIPSLQKIAVNVFENLS